MIKIGQQNLEGSETDKLWYISDRKQSYSYSGRYLHSDMIWRDGTSTADGWTGYYKTKEEAEKQLADYQKGMNNHGTYSKDNQSGKETEEGN